MVAATGVLIAAVYYVLNMRVTLQTRQAQLFIPIYSTYHSDEYMKAYSEIMRWKWENYDDYINKYGPESNPEAYIMYRKVFGFFEGVGVLVRRRLIDPSLVDDLMSGAIVQYWERFESILLERRRRLNWPQVGEQIEYLYNEVKPIAERQRQQLNKPV
jgi:hypothetical protein